MLFVPLRGVAISNEATLTPRASCRASAARSCFVNLLFARCGDEAALAPITTKHAIVSAPSDARTPPLRRDMRLLPLDFLPQNAKSAGSPTVPQNSPLERNRECSI